MKTISYIFAALKCSPSVNDTINYLVSAINKLKLDKHVEIIVVCVNDEDKFNNIQYSNLKVYVDPGNIANAWNIGLDVAENQYVCFIGDGDFPSPKLIKSICYDDNSDQDVICSYGLFYSNGNLAKRLKPPSKLNVSIFGLNVQTPCLYINRRMITGFKFNQNYTIGMDVDLLLHLQKLSVSLSGNCNVTCVELTGISVSNWKRGASEFLDVLVKNKRASPLLANIIYKLYPIYRCVKSFIRRNLVNFLRSIKHLLVFILNLSLNLTHGGYLRKLYFRFCGIRIGNGSSIRSIFRLYGIGNIVIGDNSVINRGCTLDNRGCISIGNNVSIAHNVHIYTAGHELNSPFFYQYISNVKIGDYVALFPGSVINPGVVLERGCVVLANSSVYGHFESNSIIAGNPAKKVGSRNPLYKYTSSYDFRLAQ